MQLASLVVSAIALTAQARTQQEPPERPGLSSRIRLAGTVVTPAGLPARGAVVTSSAGGEAIVGADGGFELVADVPFDVRWVEVTAALDGGKRGSLTASARVLPATSSATTSVGLLVVAPVKGGHGRWQPAFGGVPGVDGQVLAMTVFDDGGGSALYAGGSFSSAGGLAANRIARWDGEQWSALGEGIGSSQVEALAVFDDGTGPALYAGGTFETAGGAPANRVARWDGSSWATLGSGMDGTVRALAVFDDGSGPALYAAGGFSTAGGVAANNIARWDGSTWSALGNGLTGNGCRALAVFDDGSGEALYVGGGFTMAGGAPASRIARWDGSTWQALGSGTDSTVYSIRGFDDGSGPALYAGGLFGHAGGSPAVGIARWNGTSWASVGGGVGGGSPFVLSLLVFDSGGGATLHAAGRFTTAGGLPAHGAARWNGTSWTAVGDATQDSFDLLALAAFDSGQGPELHAGGSFALAGSIGANGIVRLDGAQWAALNRGPGANVRTLLSVDLGESRQLYVGGDFLSMDGVPTNRIAFWNGSTWSALGGGMTPGPSTPSAAVQALALYDDGGGEDLYAGGTFEVAGGVTATGIARWDGAQWSALGSPGFHGWMRALQVFDDGSGSALYTGATGVPASRWNGTSWANISHGMDNDVNALALFDDGAGPALYAGGAFTASNAGPLNHVARWTGSGWAALGSGTATAVRALAVFDDGSGPALYAAGNPVIGGNYLAPITRWNGASWTSVGSGFGDNGRYVHALATIDDGSGPALYAAGTFYTADGVAARSIAKWDGLSWSPLGAGLGATGTPTLALAQFADEGGPALLAGGAFSYSPAGDSYLAKWSTARWVARTR